MTVIRIIVKIELSPKGRENRRDKEDERKNETKESYTVVWLKVNNDWPFDYANFKSLTNPLDNNNIKYTNIRFFNGLCVCIRWIANTWTKCAQRKAQQNVLQHNTAQHNTTTLHEIRHTKLLKCICREQKATMILSCVFSFTKIYTCV